MIPVVRPLIFGLLLGLLTTQPGAGVWAADAGGMAMAGLSPLPPGPTAWQPIPSGSEAAGAVRAHAAGLRPVALHHLARAVLRDPYDSGARKAFGSQLLAAEEFEAAIAQFEQVLRRDPRDATAHFELALAYASAMRTDQGLESAREAVRLAPGWAAAHARLGFLLIETGQDEAGYAALGRAVSCPSLPPSVLYEIGNHYLEAGAPQQAVPYYEEALRWKPRFSYAANNLGNAFKALKQNLKARRCYEAAIAADRENPNPHNALGVLLQDEGDVKGALAAYREALRVDPTYVDAHYNAGALLLHQGKPHEALASLETACRLNPGLAVAHLRLAEAHQRLGHLAAALASYRKAIALDPQLEPQAAAFQRRFSQGRP